MLMHHRAYPESEKSLAHCISLYLNQPYHKDEGIFYPKNRDQQTALWLYNAKDVAATRGIYHSQKKAGADDPGLNASFIQVNAAIYPYLLAGLHGIGVSYSREMSRLRDDLSRRERQYRRIINCLAGSELNPRSSKKCIAYFHDALGYPAVKKSDITGAPSLAGDALYVLKTKTDNPIIDVIIAARGVGKKLSMLDFKPLIWPTKR
jgi:DNA polymerase I-like protein with 3'-5' exonuclease and polymerase domains